MIKNITVYLSSSENVSQIYKDSVIKLGEMIAKNNYTLIYGGASIGLMGVLAKTVKNNNGKVIGVIPSFMKKYEIENKECDKLITVKTMDERKKIMANLGDAYIAFPGGFGTLEEISQIITEKKLKFHRKPIIFLNINNFWEYLLKHFDKIEEEKFSMKNSINLYFVSDDLNKVFEYINNFHK